MTPRVVDTALAIWMVASAFLWPHSWAQRSIAIMFGLLAFIFALAALYRRPFRWVCAAIGALLISFGLYVTRIRAATAWNEILVGIGMIVASLVPDSGAELSTRRPRVHSP